MKIVILIMCVCVCVCVCVFLQVNHNDLSWQTSRLTKVLRASPCPQVDLQATQRTLCGSQTLVLWRHLQDIRKPGIECSSRRHVEQIEQRLYKDPPGTFTSWRTSILNSFLANQGSFAKVPSQFPLKLSENEEEQKLIN